MYTKLPLPTMHHTVLQITTRLLLTPTTNETRRKACIASLHSLVHRTLEPRSFGTAASICVKSVVHMSAPEGGAGEAEEEEPLDVEGADGAVTVAPPPQLASDVQKVPYAVPRPEQVVTPVKTLVSRVQMELYDEYDAAMVEAVLAHVESIDEG